MGDNNDTLLGVEVEPEYFLGVVIIGVGSRGAVTGKRLRGTTSRCRLGVGGILCTRRQAVVTGAAGLYPTNLRRLLQPLAIGRRCRLLTLRLDLPLRLTIRRDRSPRTGAAIWRVRR